MATRGELEEVEGVDGRSLDTGDVAESKDEVLAILIGVVDDERTTALLVTAATELTLTSTELAGVLGLLNILTSTDSLQQRNGGRGLLDGATSESGRGDDKGNLGDGADVVTAGEEKSGAS